MKKFLTIILSLLFLFALGFFFTPKKNHSKTNRTYNVELGFWSKISFNNDELYISYPYLKEYAQLDRSLLTQIDEGCLKFTFADHDYYIILGDNYYHVFYKPFMNDPFPKSLEPPCYMGFIDRNYKSIKASSSLTTKNGDTEITFGPDNLYKLYFVDCVDMPGPYTNEVHIPWVEGVKGNGIGESLTFEFNKPTTELVILNGFISAYKAKLFKENSRLKSITITDFDNNTEQKVFFDDIMYFKTVKLTHPTCNLKITIDEVYEGTKYQDTCISAIFEDVSADTLLRSKAFNSSGFSRAQKITQEEAIEKIEPPKDFQFEL